MRNCKVKIQNSKYNFRQMSNLHLPKRFPYFPDQDFLLALNQLLLLRYLSYLATPLEPFFLRSHSGKKQERRFKKRKVKTRDSTRDSPNTITPDRSQTRPGDIKKIARPPPSRIQIKQVRTRIQGPRALWGCSMQSPVEGPQLRWGNA